MAHPSVAYNNVITYLIRYMFLPIALLWVVRPVRDQNRPYVNNVYINLHLHYTPLDRIIPCKVNLI